jgi:hypothetical protein
MATANKLIHFNKKLRLRFIKKNRTLQHFYNKKLILI